MLASVRNIQRHQASAKKTEERGRDETSLPARSNRTDLFKTRGEELAFSSRGRAHGGVSSHLGCFGWTTVRLRSKFETLLRLPPRRCGDTLTLLKQSMGGGCQGEVVGRGSCVAGPSVVGEWFGLGSRARTTPRSEETAAQKEGRRRMVFDQ